MGGYRLWETNYLPYSVYKAIPYASTIYSASNPLASNRCIDTATGLFAGVSLYFEFTVDGVSDYYNLVIG